MLPATHVFIWLKMVVLSKASVPFSCYEVGHTWIPFCTSAASGIGISCFEEGFKIYSSVYLVWVLKSGCKFSGKIQTWKSNDL